MSIAVQYLPFLIICFLGVLLALALLGIAVFLGPKSPNRSKELPFESGLESTGISSKSKINVNYHLVAMLFLAFDVEIIFLYPWAANFRTLNWYGFIAISIFIFILIFGLLYEWKKGGLKWE